MWKRRRSQGTSFFSSNNAGALGFIDVNNNQVFKVELGVVTLQGQFLESEHVCLPTSFHINLFWPVPCLSCVISHKTVCLWLLTKHTCSLITGVHWQTQDRGIEDRREHYSFRVTTLAVDFFDVNNNSEVSGWI